ncbi:SHOCT domain-containing protein, partial [Arthrobacter sp. SAFR-044]|uniref:SHOCT domain-containing protein n=1 Tax=Arthrobacter sp. SAFR-044 TaxID=3387278 RepID=UPI003F7CB164
TAGQFYWPSVGIFVAAYGQFFMAANIIAHTFNNSSRRQRLEPAPPAARAGGHQVMVGKLRHNRSLASELSLLTELHAKGALSDEEFSLAKRHLLGG